MQHESPEKKRESQILVFKVSNDEFGLDISYVREVVRQQEIYPLPEAPDFVQGVINLRGRIIPLIDLRKRLGDKHREEPGKRIIICKMNKLIVGLTVDGLKDIIALPQASITPIPKLGAIQMGGDVTTGLAKMGERIIPILDLAHFLTNEETTELTGRER